MNDTTSSGSREHPSVCIIVLNWNQADLTLDSLDSVYDIDYLRFSVLLVDNGSIDGSPHKVKDRFPKTEVLRLEQNIGYSAGNNLGIERALEKGVDYVMLLNNDTLVAKDSLSKLVQAAEASPQVGITGPTMLYFEPNDVLWGGRNYVDWRRGTFRREHLGEAVPKELDDLPVAETDYVDSCAILIKREVLEKIGLLDERFFINFDDVDLNTRAKRAGYKVLYVPPARIWHKVSAAMGQASPATTYYMTRNGLLFFWRNSPVARRWLLALGIVTRTLRTTLAWSLRSKYRNESFRRMRAANLYALRDFITGRFGKMGEDVAEACYGS